MKWELILVVVALAGVRALGENLVTFPEIARGISGQSRIVGGWEANEGQIPFQLSLRMVSVVGQVFGCGASIIHSQWALTAAHCTANRPTVVIRVGATNLTRPAMVFESTEYYNHPWYNEAIAGIVQPHDVGLIKFPVSVEFNDVIQPVRMQSSQDQNRDYSGERLIASGWGANWSAGSSPEVLNWVYLNAISNQACLAAFPGSSIIVPSTICAQYYNHTTQSTCQGDSGGPLTVQDKDGQLTVVGISSFVSSQGCHVGLPAGFCRPGHYHDWYTQVTGINFDWEWPEEITTESPSEEEEGEFIPTQAPSEEEDSSESDSNEESSESDSSEEPEGSGEAILFANNH